MTELTYEEFCALPLQYMYGVTADKYAIRQYNNMDHGFGKEVNTPFNSRTWTWGKPKVVYYLFNDERNFTTPDQLYVAYMEKVCGVTA